MKAGRLQLANRTLLNPFAHQWSRSVRQQIPLRGTETHLQPSAYIRTTWSARRIGAVRTVAVQAAHNSQNLFFRLEWPDGTENRDYDGGAAFPDAACVLFPHNGDAPLATMGTPTAPIDAWYWRANRDMGEALVFSGLASEEAGGGGVLASASWSEGRWHAVIGTALPAAPVPAYVAFAVWEGGNQERAGLHSHSEWQALEIE
jgi:DMSO reductase family type II enzyme heme b subunit